jgi:cobalt-zinc-cadmium efflux system outer membrane protein
MKKTVFCLLILSSALGRAAEYVSTNNVVAFSTNGASIESLVNEALVNNPELNFYRTEISAAKAGRRSAGLLANPEVSGSVGRETAKERGSGLSAEGVAWSVSIAQPFEWPGRLALRKAIANRDIELAELGDERFKTALAGRVRALAYGLFAAQEKATATREVADRFKALREVLVQRDPAGLTPMLETRVIEATEVAMQHNAGDAELAARAALLELNRLRGASPNAPLSVRHPELVFGPAAPIDTLLAQARTNNFELRVRAVELAQQGFRVALAKNERFPTISVGPEYSENNGLERDRVIGVGVSFPLPLWNRNTANIEAAAARQIQAETSLAVAQREVEGKVLEAALTYEAKSREINEWRPDTVEHFREAAELADRHYRLGAVEVSVYVELQKQYLEAVSSLLDTQKETLEAAQSLELLTGLSVPLVSTHKGAP